MSSSTVIPARIVSLTQKHRFGELSPSESRELENWLEADTANRQAFIQLNASLSPESDADVPHRRTPRISGSKRLVMVGVILAAVLAFAWNRMISSKPAIQAATPMLTIKPFEAPGVKIDSLIEFKQASLRNVMRGISHLYGIPVVYRGSIPDSRYTARIYRAMPVGEMVELLNQVGIHSRYDGKQIIVLP